MLVTVLYDREHAQSGVVRIVRKGSSFLLCILGEAGLTMGLMTSYWD